MEEATLGVLTTLSELINECIETYRQRCDDMFKDPTYQKLFKTFKDGIIQHSEKLHQYIQQKLTELYNQP